MYYLTLDVADVRAALSRLVASQIPFCSRPVEGRDAWQVGVDARNCAFARNLLAALLAQWRTRA